MPCNCDYILNHPNGVYFVGDTIAGIAVLNNTNHKDLRDIDLRLEGRIVVRFQKQNRCGQNIVQTTNNEDRNIYKSCHIFTRQVKNLQHNLTLLRGVTTFRFSFTLGPGCYSSCEGRFGHIRYELVLEIDRITRKYNNIFRKALTILRRDDLTENISNTSGEEYGIHISTCFFGLLTSATSFALTTNLTTYAPGQFIEYKLVVHKIAIEKLNNFRIRLVKKMHFFAIDSTPEKCSDEEVIAEVPCRDQRSSYFTITGKLLVPSTPPSIQSDWLVVEYALKAESINRLCLYSYARTEAKIVIATIPIPKSLPTKFYLEKKKETMESAHCSSAPIAKDFIKRRYVEDNFGHPNFIDYDIGGLHRVSNFRPSYPVYEIPSNENEQTETEL